MVWVVSEHSSCAVMGMFSTAFRHLALMMFCMPCGQLGVFFFLLPPISVSNNFTSSHANSYKHASSARLLLLGLILVKILMSLFLHILSMKFGIVCLATARHANYPVLPSKVSRERPTRHRYYINLSRWQS